MYTVNPLNSQDLISNSPYDLLYNSHVSLENWYWIT